MGCQGTASSARQIEVMSNILQFRLLESVSLKFTAQERPVWQGLHELQVRLWIAT